jgi:acyl-CoA dehydrogenase
MQVCGAGGLSQDFHLAAAYAHSRTLRFADGPDEVHRETIAKMELRKHQGANTGPRESSPARMAQH